MNDEAELLVSCLCAAWCRTCDDYRPGFEALQREFGPSARFEWIDIEDEAALLGNLDITNFPTLLIARGDDVAFFGPVMPHVQTARQLIQRALDGSLGATTDPSANGLPARIRAL